MVEKTPWLNLATHIIIVLGLLALLFPMYLVFNAATLDIRTVNSIPPQLTPGPHLWDNLQEAWVSRDFGQKFINTLILSFGVVVGKIVIACACPSFGWSSSR